MPHFNRRIVVSGALMLGGLQLSAPICQAQTVPPLTSAPLRIVPATENAPVVAEKRGMELQRALCDQRIDLKASGATLSQLVKQIRVAMPEASIELRLSAEDKELQRQVDEDEVKLEATQLSQFSFDVKQVALGDILQSATTLAGYGFFVTREGLLITKPRQMDPTEKGPVIPWYILQNSPQQASEPITDPAFIKRAIVTQETAKLVARQLLQMRRKQGEAKEPATIRFDALAPDLQKKLQTLVDIASQNAGSPLVIVPADSPLAFDDLDKGKLRFSLTVSGVYPPPTTKHLLVWFGDTAS